LNYGAVTGAVSDLTSFSYDNQPGVVTHFEGIIGIDGGYSLAATTDNGAAFVTISRNADGSFGEAQWLAIANPASTGFCTGNSILDNHLIGVYTSAAGGAQSYVANVIMWPRPNWLLD